MEHNPSLTPTYLAGKVDEYVKFQGRDTIKRNASRDWNCRYARIPDGGACDFCKMLGSRGFVYHSEESAGSIAHGSKYDTYHPYCNCQIAVCFDPFIEKYKVGWTTVTRGYGDGAVTVTGRDKSDRLREVDIDELYAEYKSMTKDFNESGMSKYRDYTRGARLTDEQFDDAMRRLSEAKTREELHKIADDILDKWPSNENGRDQAQWNEMSKLAKQLDRQFDDTEKGRAAKSLDDWGGSFGKNLEPVRKEYRESKDVSGTFNERNKTSVSFDESIKRLPEDKRAALLAGLDKGMQVVGEQAKKIAIVEIYDFKDEETLGVTIRREGDVGVIRLSPKVFEDKTLDQIEQIAFHEVAHTAEWKFTSYGEWDAEQDVLIKWRNEKKDYDQRQFEGLLDENEEAPRLEASKTSEMLSNLFDEQGISYEYSEIHGIIIITDSDGMVALGISDYAVSGADDGMQDSELIAESIRYKANYPNGKNKVAVAVASRFL